MSNRVPITLLVDDPCPLVHVYRYHWEEVHQRPATTADGRPLLDVIPNDFLTRFCDVVEHHGMAGKFSIVPYIAYQRGDTTLVSINSTVDDFFWETIDNPRTDRAYLEAVTDRLLTADGRGGAIRTVLEARGWPILMTHWQSFFSNGLETGLAVLDLLGERVTQTLADEVVWATCMEVAQATLAD